MVHCADKRVSRALTFALLMIGYFQGKHPYPSVICHVICSTWLTWLQTRAHIKPPSLHTFDNHQLICLLSCLVQLLSVFVLRSLPVLVARTLPCTVLVRRLLLRTLFQSRALLVRAVREPRVTAHVALTTRLVLLETERLISQVLCKYGI